VAEGAGVAPGSGVGVISIVHEASSPSARAAIASKRGRTRFIGSSFV
jgi:hypothetical protein